MMAGYKVNHATNSEMILKSKVSAVYLKSLKF